MPDLNALRINGATYDLPSLNAIKINGVTYAISGGASASGTYQTSTTENITIDIGFKPKFLAIQAAPGAATMVMMIYSEDFSADTYKYATGGAYAQNRNLNTDTAGARLYSINENGFTVCPATTVVAFSYFALG